MSKLETELNQLIKDNLPESGAKILQEQLNKIDMLEEEVLVLTEELENTRVSYTALENECKSLHALKEEMQNKIKELSHYKEREEAIEKRERNLEVEILDRELTLTQQSKDDIFKLVDKFMGHPAVTVDKYITKTDTKNMVIPEGGYTTCMTDTCSENESVTNTESKR